MFIIATLVSIGLSLVLASTIANPIVPVKHGTKTQPWQIDAISGATISSNAVARMLNDSGQQYVPIIINNQNVLEAR